jgi:CBS domain-containing protein
VLPLISQTGIPAKEIAVRIRDILKDKGGEVATIGAGRTVHEAVRELNSHRIGALVVTGDDGSIEGIVSERDVLRMAAETWDDGADRTARLRDRPVVAIMTREVICAVPDDDLDYAMGIMTKNRIRHLPIVDGGKLVGIISIGDVVRANLSQVAYENRMLKDYVQGGGAG